MEYKTDKEIMNEGVEFCKQLDALEDEFASRVENKDLWEEMKQCMDNMNEEQIALHIWL